MGQSGEAGIPQVRTGQSPCTGVETHLPLRSEEGQPQVLVRVKGQESP